MTSEEYARKVQAVILSAGARAMENEPIVGANAAAGLYQLALGGSAAVRGKGREYEADDNTQSFEKPGARAVDFIAEARDEFTDAAAWITAATELSTLDRTERDRYVAYIAYHLALAIDALDSWAIWERTSLDMELGFIRPEDQPA